MNNHRTEDKNYKLSVQLLDLFYKFMPPKIFHNGATNEELLKRMEKQHVPNLVANIMLYHKTVGQEAGYSVDYTCCKEEDLALYGI
jgi:hypothetical protein